MVKKIGILTFSTADNYRPVLQTYALKYTLRNMGNPIHVIDFYCSKKLRTSQFFYNYKPTILWFVKRVFNLFYRPVLWYYGNHCFVPFCKRYLEDTPRVYHENLPQLCDNYDNPSVVSELLQRVKTRLWEYLKSKASLKRKVFAICCCMNFTFTRYILKWLTQLVEGN